MNLSVIICTYNPDETIFNKCLEAISVASVLKKPYEIIIIDNNSTNLFSKRPFVQEFIYKHSAKLICETKAGLTPARLRGITEATGDLLVFIDDDNFIAENFFIKGLDIAKKYQHTGSWSGRVTLEFEEEPASWTKPYWGMLVHRDITDDKWSNLPHLAETMPCGAGLYVRKNVADHYLELHRAGKRSVQMDRNGNSLFSAGDNDLAACACDIGMGVGVFHELKVVHYIPGYRTQKEYLLKLAQGIAASGIVFRSFRGEYPDKLTAKKRIANTIRWLLKASIERQFFKAVLNGEKQGRAILEKENI